MGIPDTAGAPRWCNSRSSAPSPRRRNLATCVLMVMVIFIVSLSSFCLLRRMCDLKAENRRLRAEHQRYEYLKQVVRARVPEDVFLHTVPRSVSIIEADPVPEEEAEKVSWWSVSLSVLWTPDTITRCDIGVLAHRLAHEIYRNMEL